MSRDVDVDREDVLIAFASTCRSPRPRDVRRWRRRYPRFGDEILALAVDLAKHDDAPGAEGAWEELRAEAGVVRPDPAPMETPSFIEQRKLHLDLLARFGEAPTPFPDDEDLAGVLLWYGADFPGLAAHLDIAPGVVERAAYGGLAEPYGERFLDALALAFGRSRGEIAAAIARGGAPEHLEGPGMEPAPFRALVERSGMNEERKAYWLADPPSSVDDDPPGDARRG